ncbi:hypothetical protein ABK040_015692 [Willaertia magna]
MKTFERKRNTPTYIKVEQSPNFTKKVSLFKDIDSDKEEDNKKKRKKNSQEDPFHENVFSPEKKKLTTQSKSTSTSSSINTPIKPSSSSNNNITPKASKPFKSPSSSEKKKKDNFFKDDLLEDVFDYSFTSSDEETVNNKTITNNNKTKKKEKKKKKETTPKKKNTISSVSTIKRDGQEQIKKDNLSYLLQGIKSNSLDVKYESACALVKMITEGDDLSIFLRAHGLIKQVISTLVSEIDFKNQKLFSLTCSQIIGILLKDPLNAEYVSEDCFKILHNVIKLHHVLKSQQSTLSPNLNRTKRTRMASLKHIIDKDIVNFEEEEKNRQFEKQTISLALVAMVNIVNYQQLQIELNLVKIEKEKQEEYIEKKSKESFFNKFETIETIERLVPCILALLENNRDDLLAFDMCNCIKMLEKNGILKYIGNSNSQYWNYLLPALIRLLHCLTPPTKTLLSELKDGHPVLECTLITLRFLTNISNYGSEICKKIVEEHGILGVCSVLSSSYVEHFDILTMCLGLLTNLTEHCWENRDLLRNFKFEFRGKSMKLITFILNLFKEYYAKQEYNNEEENANNSNPSELITENNSQLSDNATANIVDQVNNEKKQQMNSTSENRQAKSNHIKETEDNIITSYLAILLGCLCKDNEKNRELIKKNLPDQNFQSIVIALKAFIIYQSRVRLLTKETLESIQSIVASCEEEENEDK